MVVPEALTLKKEFQKGRGRLLGLDYHFVHLPLVIPASL